MCQKFKVFYVFIEIVLYLISCSFCKHRAALREILAKTNLIVMIDDPIISTNLEEFLLQFHSGLTMGSVTSGLVTPQGNLLLTSNTDVTQRFN